MTCLASWPPAMPGPAPAIDSLDRGFLLGDGVFDTLTVFGGKPFAWAEHRERLIRAAARLAIPADPSQLDRAMAEICAALRSQNAIVRTTLTRGKTERGLWPGAVATATLALTAQPWSAHRVGEPAKLVTASTPRNERSLLSRLKTLNYLDNILAAREAAEKNADDALILNIRGAAASSTIANLFTVRGSMLVTPPLADGVLDGILRRMVMDEAATLGLTCQEESVMPERLLESDGVFLTNSVRFIRPVLAIDGQAVPQSPYIQPLLDSLAARVEAACGTRPFSS